MRPSLTGIARDGLTGLRHTLSADDTWVSNFSSLFLACALSRRAGMMMDVAGKKKMLLLLLLLLMLLRLMSLLTLMLLMLVT